MEVDADDDIIDELGGFEEEIEEASEDEYQEVEVPEEKQLEEFDETDMYDYKSIRDRVNKMYLFYYTY